MISKPEENTKNLIRLILLRLSFFPWCNFHQRPTTQMIRSQKGAQAYSYCKVVEHTNPGDIQVRKLNYKQFLCLFILHMYWTCLELQNLHSSLRWRNTGIVLNFLYCFPFYTLPIPDGYWPDDQEKHKSQSVIIGTHFKILSQ